MNEPLCRSESPSAYKILLGIHTERATESSKQERDVSKIIKGPAGTDIALLKLDRLVFCCPPFMSVTVALPLQMK